MLYPFTFKKCLTFVMRKYSAFIFNSTLCEIKNNKYKVVSNIKYNDFYFINTFTEILANLPDDIMVDDLVGFNIIIK